MAQKSKSLSKRLCWTVDDPDGFHVSLEKDCWHGHILREHRHHMKRRLLDTKTTVEKPDRVDRFTTGARENRVYFKRWKDRDPSGNEYLKVPTEVINPKEKVARVLTAHPLWILPPPVKE